MTGQPIFRRFSLKTTVFRLLSIVLAFVMVCLAGECLTRLLSPIGPRLFHERRYEPNYAGVVYNLESRRSIPLRTNADGFRGENVSLDKPTGVIRVAVIGDSFVAAMSVEESESFTQLIGDKLTRELNRTVEALNFGVSGADFADYIQFYRHFAAKYEPDIVVFCFFHGNDLTGRFPELADSDRPHPYADYVQPKFKGYERFLGRHSRFYMWYETKLRHARDTLRVWGRKHATSAYFASMKKRFERRFDDYRIFVAEEPQGIANDWQVVERHIACMYREVTQAGSQFLLVGIPRAEQVYDDLWVLLCKEGQKKEGQGWSRFHPDKRLTAICRRHGVAYLPLLDRLRAEGEKASLYFGREHFNTTGHKIAADSIVDELYDRQMLVADKRSNAPRL